MTRNSLAVAFALAVATMSVQTAGAQEGQPAPATGTTPEATAPAADTTADTTAPATGTAAEAPAPDSGTTAPEATAPAADLGAPTTSPALATDSATPANGVLATGLHRKGEARGEVTGALIDGDRVTVKVTFLPVDPEGNVDTTTVYTMSDNTYESIYLLAGDKKYMLLKDSQDKVLASDKLLLTPPAGAGSVGNWYGVFPAPPADAKVTLYLPEVEPLGPFNLQQ